MSEHRFAGPFGDLSLTGRHRASELTVLLDIALVACTAVTWMGEGTWLVGRIISLTVLVAMSISSCSASSSRPAGADDATRRRSFSRLLRIRGPTAEPVEPARRLAAAEDGSATVISMVEPVSVVAGAARAVGPAVAASRLALRKLRQFGTFELRWVEYGDAAGFTANEINALEEFLTERETRALLGVLASTLLIPDSKARGESLETVRSFFMNHAQRYRAAHPSSWFDRREAVWDARLRIYDDATPAGSDLAAAAVEFEDFLRTPLDRGQATGSSGIKTRYVERMAELCSNIERVVAAIDLAGSLKSALADAPTPPIITYRSTSSVASFKDLYVDRRLVDQESATTLSGFMLGKRGSPYRAVVHGAPGAGKSTFVRHLRSELAHDADSPPALLVTLRNYFPLARTQSIVEHISEDVRTSFSVEIDPAGLRDVLTLGHAVIIFDGLDEIRDTIARVDMASRIASFAREFPALSILVTSRSIGYERAPLPYEMFRTYVLDEYTAEQSREYARRWFAFIGRDDLTDEFERESESVRDLRSNPLLLSLLCILYGERGSIPRRRRGIYEACADLLFHTWDAHRRIDQPEELHTHGDRIMQEIAQWVYKSQKAQSGLSERVIKKSIGIYLRETVGVEDGEARRRAGEFLEFCATRAWLLAATGTEHGERLFGFTHRTFFEFFTAEAFSRTSRDPAEVATILIEAHAKDATSVLPELLLQAIDDKIDRGGANTFRMVCRQTKDESLILRLMEGVGLPTAVRAEGFERVLAIWRSRREFSPSAFVSLLTLNPDARVQFVRDYLGGSREDAVDLFLGGWATLATTGGTARYEAIWAEVVGRIAAEHKPIAGTWYVRELQSWLWRGGQRSMPPSRGSLYVTTGAWGECLGTLWYSLEFATVKAPARIPGGVSRVFTDAVADGRNVNHRLSAKKAHDFVDRVLDRLENATAPDATKLEGESLWAYLYAVGIVYEVTRRSPDEAETLKQSLPAAGHALWVQRDQAARRDRGARNVPSVVKPLPAWLRNWGSGRASFVDERFMGY